MFAEIVAIGTELTSGEKLDTNSQWLSLQLADLGIPVLFHTTVADNLAANVQALQLAVDRVDIVLITGGLGPTLDDLTREVLAQLAGVELLCDEASLKALEDFFRGRGREMPVRNRIQAMFPRGSVPLANPIGTAPGIWMALARPGRNPCLIAAMPGVPSEMHTMFFEQVRPKLPGGQRVIRRARINCFGLGESATEELLGDLTARGRDPEVGITAHEATITLRIVAQGATEAECRAKLSETAAAVHQRLGNFVFGVEDEELEDVVLAQLAAAGQTLCTLEWATAGRLAASLAAGEMRRNANSPAQPKCPLAGGQVLSGICDDLPTAARDWQRCTGADYVLAIGSEEIEPTQPPTVITDLVLLGPNGFEERLALTWNGNPAILRSRAAKTGLDLLRKHWIEERLRE